MDSAVGKPPEAVHNTAQPVGRRWTTARASLWTENDPQPVDIFCPLIPTLPTWTDDLSLHPPVDRIWTTPQSPSCGRHEPDESVENPAAQVTIRTAGPGRTVDQSGRRGRKRGGKSSRATAFGSPSAHRGRPGDLFGPGAGPVRCPAGASGASGASGAHGEAPSTAWGRRRTGIMRVHEGVRARTGLVRARAGRAGPGRGVRAPVIRRRARSCQPFLMRLVSSVTWL